MIFWYCIFFTQAFLIMMLFRNGWVHSTRNKILKSGLREFYKLPSYNTMMLKFWIWNVDKFKKNN